MAPEKNCPESCPAHSGVVANQEHTNQAILDSKDFMNKMMTNHLPHIEAEIASTREANTKNYLATKNWLIGVLVSIILLLLATGASILAG